MPFPKRLKRASDYTYQMLLSLLADLLTVLAHGHKSLSNSHFVDIELIEHEQTLALPLRLWKRRHWAMAPADNSTSRKAKTSLGEKIQEAR
jgi:hypothetical protein